MPRSQSAAMGTMLAHRTNGQTLAEYVRVGSVYMTSHVTDLTIDGLLHKAQLGFVRGAFRESLEQHLSTLSFQAYFDPSGITRDAVVSKTYEGADAYFGVCDYTNPANTIKLLRGWVGRITIRDHGYELEIRSMLDRLNQQVGQTVSPSNVGQFLPGMNAISNP